MRGDALRAIAARLFDERTMARVIDPAIADLQREPPSIGGYVSVLKTMLVCAPEVSMRIGTTAVVSVFVVLAVNALLALPTAVFALNQHVFEPRMLVYLVPQGFSIALALAVFFGTLTALQGRRPTRAIVAAVLLVALGASLVSFVNAAWVTPGANQLFRSAFVAGQGGPAPPRGFPELTLSEVRQQYAFARATQTVDSTDLHYVAVSYQGRWAVTVAPLAFALFALTLARLKPRAPVRWGIAALVAVAYLGYLLSLSIPRLAAIDGPWLGGAAWYPEVALAIIALVLMFVDRREAHAAAG